MNNIWKRIIDYEDEYAVSNHGDVWSYRRGKILKACSNGNYYVVSLSKNNISKSICIHKLVARAFIGTRPLGKNINHIDGHRYNNESKNLEYVTQKENVHNSVRLGLHPKGIRHGKAKLTEAEVLKIREIHKDKKKIYRHTAIQFRIDASVIKEIINRTLWKHI